MNCCHQKFSGIQFVNSAGHVQKPTSKDLKSHVYTSSTLALVQRKATSDMGA